MDEPSKEDEQRFVYAGAIRVTATKTDAFDFAIRSRLVEQWMGTEKLPPAPEKESALSETFLRIGVRQYEWERYADEAEFRVSRLLWFVFPAGDSDREWTAVLPEVRVGWGAAAEVRYRRLGATQRLNRKCLLYSVSFREKGAEHPMAAEGRIEIDEAAGILMAAQMEARNAPLPGAEERQSLKVIYTVTSLKTKSDLP